MKGKINDMGLLIIWRGGKQTVMKCPHGMMNCRDWCPLFGEPYDEQRHSTNQWPVVDLGPTGRTLLDLCHKTLVFDEFTDERVTKC